MRQPNPIRIPGACLATCLAIVASTNALATVPSASPVPCDITQTSCTIDVAVTGDAQACTVKLKPAYMVTISNPGTPKQVQWHITGDQRYEFASGSGVAMKPQPGASSPWQGGTGQGRTFTMTLKSPAEPVPADGSITFDVTVIDKQKNDMKCGGDPIIGNGKN